MPRLIKLHKKPRKLKIKPLRHMLLQLRKQPNMLKLKRRLLPPPLPN